MENLIKIQSELNAPKNQFNSFGKYKYRSCEDVLEALKPLLLKYNCVLTINDEIVQIGERYYIKATATITDWEKKESVSAFARESEEKKGMDSSQVTGATSSYARKYALNWLFLIDDSKDADTMDNSKTEKEEKPRYNDSNIEALKKAIADGSVTNAEETIKKIQEKFKLSTKNKEIVLSLFK